MQYDFNDLESSARKFLADSQPQKAVKIYLYMADGDQSLDGGYLGEQIGKCYEALGDLHAAKYWYARAVEENPGVRVEAVAALRRLEKVTISAVLEGNEDAEPDLWEGLCADAAYEFGLRCARLVTSNPYRSVAPLNSIINSLMTELWDRNFSQSEIRVAFEGAIKDMPRYAAGQERRSATSTELATTDWRARA